MKSLLIICAALTFSIVDVQGQDIKILNAGWSNTRDFKPIGSDIYHIRDYNDSLFFWIRVSADPEWLSYADPASEGKSLPLKFKVYRKVGFKTKLNNVLTPRVYRLPNSDFSALMHKTSEKAVEFILYQKIERPRTGRWTVQPVLGDNTSVERAEQEQGVYEIELVMDRRKK